MDTERKRVADDTACRQSGVSTPVELMTLLLPAVMLAALIGAQRDWRVYARTLHAPDASHHAVLRVCADPNNLPFSNRAGEGFENRIADLLGTELRRPVSYTWWAERRGFVRNTVGAGLCDLVVGTSAGMELLSTTRPYYKSTYVFVSRHDRHLGVRSFDDTLLRKLRIGVQLIGDDFANTPPVHALGNRGLTRNLRGYPVYGDYSQQNPPARIIDAVVRGDVDLAVVWGPLAGYFARRAPVPLDVVPVSPRIDLPYLPFVFDIAMGVRRGDSTFRAQLDDVIVRRRASIDSILASYGVPRVDVADAARSR